MEGRLYNFFAPNLINICIDEVENQDYSGRIWNQFSSEAILFSGMRDMMFRIDEMFDGWDFPQRGTNYRSFAKPEDTSHRKRSRQERKKLDTTHIDENRGEKGTFIIQVQYRQNSTWQGQVTWVEQNKKQHFRSALELMKMIDSAVNSQQPEAEEAGF